MGAHLPSIEQPWLRLPLRIVQGFLEHRGPVRAASLSYTSLLALVPLIALVLSVSKWVVKAQDPETLPAWVDQALAYAVPQLQVLSREETEAAREDVLERIHEAIDRINAGALGVFGAITLATVGITLLSAVEAALNNVWGVAKGRPLARRVVYYWSGITLGSVVLIFSLGLTGSIAVASYLGILPGPLAFFVLRSLTPFCALAGGFTLLYWAMPNTAVPLRAAAWGGIAAALLFHLNSQMSALYFGQVVGYSKVYGSLGAIPVLMVGLYLAWAIVLIGAEVTYALASPPTDRPGYPDSPAERGRLALEVACIAAGEFLSGRGGVTAPEIASRLAVPLDWVNRTTGFLVGSGILVAADCGPGEDAPERLLPARPPRKIAAAEVLRSAHGAAAPADGGEGSRGVRRLLARVEAAEEEALAGLTLEDLATGASEAEP